MRKLFLASLMVALLLLAGCIQLPGKAGEEKKETKPGEVKKEEEQKQEKEQATEQKQQNYDEMTMGALMNLGVPIKCVITYHYQEEGMSGTAVEYIIGKKARIESIATTKEGSTSSTMIAKEDGAYVKVPPEMKSQGGVYANCDWLFYPRGEDKEYEINEEEKVGAEYKKLGYDYTARCEPATFGEEKFATPGKVCSIKEIMSNVCASIEDPEAKAQCEQVMVAQ